MRAMLRNIGPFEFRWREIRGWEDQERRSAGPFPQCMHDTSCSLLAARAREDLNAVRYHTRPDQTRPTIRIIPSSRT
jgi:hypothetical protein